MSWLAGVVDGDGSFSFRQNQNGSWDFSFKISASIYNLRLLKYIERILGCGSITFDSDKCQFRIRNPQILMSIIIPIFLFAPLRTHKSIWFDYFYLALKVYLDPSLDLTTRDNKILALLAERDQIQANLESTFKSPIWFIQTDLNLILCKPWVVGFFEAEGSFYYITKNNQTGRIVHGFGCTQKLDKHILEGLRTLFGIKAKIKLLSNGAYLCESTAQSTVEFAMEYFNSQFRGIKALEFRIWCMAFRKYKNDYFKLSLIRNWIRNRRNNHKLR